MTTEPTTHTYGTRICVLSNLRVTTNVCSRSHRPVSSLICEAPLPGRLCSRPQGGTSHNDRWEQHTQGHFRAMHASPRVSIVKGSIGRSVLGPLWGSLSAVCEAEVRGLVGQMVLGGKSRGGPCKVEGQCGKIQCKQEGGEEVTETGSGQGLAAFTGSSFWNGRGAGR